MIFRNIRQDTVKLFEKFILNFFKNDYQFLDSKVVVD